MGSLDSAVQSLQSAFLKTLFPIEFMVAVISNQDGSYSTLAYVSEARRMGLKNLPPDVNGGAQPELGHICVRFWGYDIVKSDPS